MRFTLFACVSSLLAPVVITARLSSVKHDDHNNEQHKQHKQLLLDSSSFLKLKLNEGVAILRREFRNIDDVKDNNNNKKDAPTIDTTDYNSDSYPPSLADDSYDPTVGEEGGAEGAYQKENNYYVNHYDVGISFMNEKLNDEEAVDHYNDHHYHQQQQLDERHLQQLNCNEICSGPRPVVLVGADTVRDSHHRRARGSDRRGRDRDRDRRSRDTEPNDKSGDSGADGNDNDNSEDAPLLKFSDLINACLDNNSNCPKEFSLSEINCWNTERVTDMESAFRSQSVFNEPLECWNTSRVTKMDDMFFKATSFNQPINNWDTSSVTSMHFMFGVATSFNQPIDDWNTSRVKTMDNMVFLANSFNQPINNWDTSSVTSMRFMFSRATFFNQPIGDWNTSRVKTMDNMFFLANSFNQPIDAWDTSSVTSTHFMFSKATSFNQPIDDWNTSRVKTMDNMFFLASSFNQPINNWDTSSVTSTHFMFGRANSFNQPIDDWNTSRVKTMENMFFLASSFNQPIDAWDTSLVTSTHFMFGRATSFNQCLSTWAEKTSNDVTTNAMFENASCTGISTPFPNLGPWCQGARENCFAPSAEPSGTPSNVPSFSASPISASPISSQPTGNPTTDEPTFIVEDTRRPTTDVPTSFSFSSSPISASPISSQPTDNPTTDEPTFIAEDTRRPTTDVPTSFSFSSLSASPSESPSFESISHEVCGTYAVHARTSIIFDGVSSTIHHGDVGVSPGTSITGDFSFNNEGNATGLFEIDVGEVNPFSTEFAASVLSAHGDAMADHSGTEVTIEIEIGGLTFIPGTYRSDNAINFAHGTVVTLDGLNEPNPEFLFIAASFLVTAADTSFNLINGAKAENILWALGTAATLGARSVVEGSILAGTAITFGTKSELHGCALAQSTVTFASEGSVVLNHYEADGIFNAISI